MLRFRLFVPLVLATIFLPGAISEGHDSQAIAGGMCRSSWACHPFAGRVAIWDRDGENGWRPQVALWPNFSDEFDNLPYFVRFPVTHYDYCTLLSGGRFLYRSDVARLWSPGKLAYYAAQRPWFYFASTAQFREDGSRLAPSRDIGPAIASSPVPVLVRNPWLDQRPPTGDKKAEDTATNTLVRVGSSEPVALLRISNPHVSP